MFRRQAATLPQGATRSTEPETDTAAPSHMINRSSRLPIDGDPTPPPWLYATMTSATAAAAGPTGGAGAGEGRESGAWWATPAFAAAAAALAGRGGEMTGVGGAVNDAAGPLADLVAGWQRLGGGG